MRKTLAASLALAFALGPVAAQDVFQLQISDGTTTDPNSVLITQSSFGTIDMACNVNMAGGWYDVIYDCDADDLIPQLLPAATNYGTLLSGDFSGAHAVTLTNEHGADYLPMRVSVVSTALDRALKDGSGLSSSAVMGRWEGIDSHNVTTNPNVVFQHYTGVNNPLMFRVSNTSNLLHFEAMRQHAMWERIAGFVIANGLVDPGDVSQLTPAQADRAWRLTFFNSDLYTRFARLQMRLRIAAIHVRGRNLVASHPQPPAELLGMPAIPPKSRLSSPAVVTFSPATVPWVHFTTPFIKIVPPGTTLDYQLGGFVPGMQVAITKTAGGATRHELDVRWHDFGKTEFTLPSTMSHGVYEIAEARHRIHHANGTWSWAPWQVLDNQPVIHVYGTGGMGN